MMKWMKEYELSKPNDLKYSKYGEISKLRAAKR